MKGAVYESLYLKERGVLKKTFRGKSSKRNSRDGGLDRRSQV